MSISLTCIQNRKTCKSRAALTLILLGLWNANGNVLVLLAVMEAHLHQILLDAEAVEDGVLHGPGHLPRARLDDGVDFLVGSLP